MTKNQWEKNEKNKKNKGNVWQKPCDKMMQCCKNKENIFIAAIYIIHDFSKTTL